MPEVVTIPTLAPGEGRTAEVPAGEVWIHCAGGFRASIGASILDRAGRRVLHVDDDWGKRRVVRAAPERDLGP